MHIGLPDLVPLVGIDKVDRGPDDLVGLAAPVVVSRRLRGWLSLVVQGHLFRRFPDACLGKPKGNSSGRRRSLSGHVDRNSHPVRRRQNASGRRRIGLRFDGRRRPSFQTLA